MRTSLVIEKVLATLQAHAEATASIFDVLTSGYHESYRKAHRTLSGRYEPGRFRHNWAEAYRDRQKFYNLLNHLKREHLIENKKEGRSSLWRITAQGLEKLKLLKERNRYAKQRAEYEDTGTEESFKIIAYDIPVGERKEGQKKRDWLRWALKNLGFTMLQKSVWVGKRKIPEVFVHDLCEREMVPHVHIFEVAKSGTLREVI